MTREVTHTARGPYELTADDVDEEYGDVAVCLCGLSADPPFCDGSHRRAADEETGVRYKYVDGDRYVVEFVYADAGGDESEVDGEVPGRTGADAETDGDDSEDGDGER
jgi:CDGSH-type Zn-finger protein